MLSDNAVESKLAVYEETRLREAWGDRIDPNEFIRDSGDYFGSTVYNAYTSIYDRSDGRYRPVYQNEMDLRRVRAMAWFVYETVPAAAAWANRLLDYTIGTGFDWSVKPVAGDNKLLANAAKAWVDRVFENSNWSSNLERESFLREVVDGEFLASIESSMGSVALVSHESDELTEPASAHALNEWLDIDFVPSWSFGVLSRQNRNATHLGYHLVHNTEGTDWDFYRPYKFEFWKRNSRANAKRGFSDFHRSFLHIARSDMVLTNTAEGAANQAAIAYIVEHAESSSATDIERFAQANSYMAAGVDPLTRTVDRRKRLKSGTRLDVRGAKFHAGLLGSNKSDVYIQVMEASLRVAGTVHAFPEGMLTGSYQNNNYASSLTAESPFVQGRMADQAARAMRVKSMIRKILCCGFEMGAFRSFNIPDVETFLGMVEVLVIPSKIVHRDPLQLTQALIAQENQGYVSRLTAMNELGRDPEVEIAQGARPKEGGEGPAGGSSGGPGGGGGGSGPDADPTKPPASWANLSRLQLVRNMRAYKDVVAGLRSGEMSSSEARAMLSQIGFDSQNIDLILKDMKDGQQDFPLKESASGCSGRHARLVASRYRKFLRRLKKKKRVRESFDPSQPRGKDGKWIWAGIDYKGWPKHIPAAESVIKSIQAMEHAAANGNWVAVENTPTVSDPHADYVGPYSKAKWQAKQNLLKIKALGTGPKGAKSVGDGPVLKGWSKVGGQLGTEKGGTYIGPDGKKYYVKTPDNPLRAHNEVLASKLYEAAGAAVVPANLVDVDGKVAVATLWAADAAKIDWNDPAARAQAHQDFAVHAWLANWDAVGAGSENPMDNIKMIGGEATLVDAGGSLEYSGMGGSGKKPFDGEVSELLGFKKSSVNPTMAQVFGDMTPAEEIASLKRVASVPAQDVADLVQKYHGGTQAEKAAMTVTLLNRQEKIKARAMELEANFGIGAGVSDVPVEAPAAVMTAAELGPSALPKPPFTTSVTNQAYNKKFAALHELAVAGDVAGVEAYVTNAVSQATYPKKVHAYKQQLLAALKGGAVASSPAVAPVVAVAAPATAAAPAGVPSWMLPGKPVFQSSNDAQVAVNTALIDTLETSATSGNWDKVDEIASKAKSPKVVAYAEQLKALKGSGSVEAKAAAMINAPVVAKVGFWQKLGMPPEALADKKVGKLSSTTLVPLPEKTWDIGLKKHDSLKGVNDLGRATLDSYTGGGYGWVNTTLREGATAPDIEAMKSAWSATVQPVPEGIVLSRTHANYADGVGEITLEHMQSLVGSVVSDKGFLSTSAGVIVFDHNDVHWKIKTHKGLKGVMAKRFGVPSENEVILGTEQKMFVRAAFHAQYDGRTIIEVHAETVE